MAFEKVNCYHPDKVADRIAGALVDLAYKNQNNPKVAVEVLIGHGMANVITESSYAYTEEEVKEIIDRIVPGCALNLVSVPQDYHLAENQGKEVRCGDNGIFKGAVVTYEERKLAAFAKEIAEKFPYDGKYIADGDKIIVCHSNIKEEDCVDIIKKHGYKEWIVNPIGDWTGGINVDSGATNRKLGSDMAESITGGGLHGKDCSKADVSVNIYAFLKAQSTGEEVNLHCAIGDKEIDGKPYDEIVDIAMDYIKAVGGFEKFAEWGLVG